MSQSIESIVGTDHEFYLGTGTATIEEILLLRLLGATSANWHGWRTGPWSDARMAVQLWLRCRGYCHHISFRIGVAQHVNRVAHACGNGKFLAKCGCYSTGQRADFHAALLNSVGCHYAWSAGVGNDRDAVSRGQRLHGKRRGVIKQGSNVSARMIPDRLNAAP